MSSVLHKIKRKKNNARDFQITASVAALKIQCQRDSWHPENLVIYWDKDDTRCYTKPVPWQPGINNPLSGIHVWPEPDPVIITSTLYKNINREGTYEDYPLEIVVKNETKSGRHHIIATGCIDMADYISETLKTFNITVTLKPSDKNILSGSIEFSLTSVMLEDGIPYRPKEEQLREILQDLMKPTSSGIKTTKRRKADKRSKKIPMENLDTFHKLELTVPALPSSEDKIVERSNVRESSSQAGAITGLVADISNNGVPKRTRRKAPLPPGRPSLTRHKIPSPDATPSVGNKPNNKEVKSSSTEGNGDEKVANKAGTSPPQRRKRSKKTKKSKYPKELNPFGGSSDEEMSLSSKNAMEQECEERTTEMSDRQGDGEHKASCFDVSSQTECQKTFAEPRKTKVYPKTLNPFGVSFSDENSLSSEGTSTSKGTPEQVRKGGTTKVPEQGDGEEKIYCTEVPSSPGRRKNRKSKKSKKYPKELNPFGGSSDEEAGVSSKKSEIKEFLTTKGTDKGEPEFANKDGFSDEGIVLQKATSENTDEVSTRDESPGSKVKDVVHYGGADTVATLDDGASGCGEHPSSSKAMFPPSEETDSTATEKEKQKLDGFNKKLLLPILTVSGMKTKAPPKPPRHSLLRKKTSGDSQTEVFPDLSAYVAEELKLLQEELASVDKVTVKLELEMSQAIKIKDCKEELDGLIQDWLSLTDYRDDLSSRKRDLQTLNKQEDLDQCCNVLRSELKLLFKLEDWCKSHAMKSKELQLMDFLISFTNKRRGN